MWRLAVVLLVAACARAAEPVVPRGHEYKTYCNACLDFVGGLEVRLLPELEASSARRAAAAKRGKGGATIGMGEIDELAGAYVESGCGNVASIGSKGHMEACRKLLEKHGDEMAVAIAKWKKADRPKSELRGLLCAKVGRACRTTDLTRAAAAPKKEFQTQRPPATNDGPVFTVVGETLGATLGAPHRDVLLYFRFRFEGKVSEDWKPGDPPAARGRDEQLRPRVHRLAELLAALPRRPKTLLVAEIDADANELPPPYDQIKRAAVVLFPAEKDGTRAGEKEMMFFEWLDPELDLGEVLSNLGDHVTEKHSHRHVSNLLVQLGAARLWDSDRNGWWEDDELLARARAPYDPPANEAAADADPDASASDAAMAARKAGPARGLGQKAEL